VLVGRSVFQCLIPSLKLKGYHVLRYNSRGVGDSTGRASFTGFDEAKDLGAVIQWVSTEIPCLSEVLLVVRFAYASLLSYCLTMIQGYSHGSLIASLQPPRVGEVKISHLLIAYPLGPRSFLTLFRGSHYNSKLAELVQNPDSRILIVYGDQDEFTSIERYDAWAAELEALPGTNTSGHLQVSKVAGASHFWRGEAAEHLISTVSSWIAST
jgi:uncharacterized protein